MNTTFSTAPIPRTDSHPGLASPPPTPRHPHKILVVEDDPGSRATITEFLQQAGYDVTAAEDGILGVEAAMRQQPDLIVSDICMPRLDGFKMLAKLRQVPELVDTPVIFLSALSESQDIRTGLRGGADDYLIKPFQPSELLQAIELRWSHRRIVSERLDRFRERVARILPHELRTPLVGILGFSDLLLENAKDRSTMSAAEVAKHARYIHDSGRRLLDLTERCTLWMDLTAHREEIRADAAHWSCVHWVAGAKTILERLAEDRERSGDLQLHLPAAFALAVPSGYMERILFEIVDNAFKFSTAGQPVIVEARQVNDQVTITVTDLGRGFPQNLREAIGAFEQFDREFWEQQGLGLGLAISQLFMQLVGGTMALSENPAGSGTQVVLTIPLAARAPRAA